MYKLPKVFVHYESGIFSLHISDISTYKKYQRKKRYISFPASIAKSAHFISKKIILHSLFSFCSISFGRLSYIIFKTFITFSESTCCTDRQVMKNITQNTAPCFTQHYFWQWVSWCYMWQLFLHSGKYSLENRLLAVWFLTTNKMFPLWHTVNVSCALTSNYIYR